MNFANDEQCPRPRHEMLAAVISKNEPVLLSESQSPAEDPGNTPLSEQRTALKLLNCSDDRCKEELRKFQEEVLAEGATLPDGWRCTRHLRLKGNLKGGAYTKYHPPVGPSCRSKTVAREHLGLPRTCKASAKSSKDVASKQMLNQTKQGKVTKASASPLRLLANFTAAEVPSHLLEDGMGEASDADVEEVVFEPAVDPGLGAEADQVINRAAASDLLRHQSKLNTEHRNKICNLRRQPKRKDQQLDAAHQVVAELSQKLAAQQSASHPQQDLPSQHGANMPNEAEIEADNLDVSLSGPRQCCQDKEASIAELEKALADARAQCQRHAEKDQSAEAAYDDLLKENQDLKREVYRMRVRA